MENLLTKIKKCAEQGIEKAILQHNDENKNLFLNIMLNAELGLEKLRTNTYQSGNIQNNTYNARTYEIMDDNTKNKMYLIAFCFSYFEHESLFPNNSQNEAFDIVAKKLGVKKHTLKNTRDWFDGHNNSTRKGWWQTPLPEPLQKFKNIYEKKDKNAIISEAKNILEI